MVMVVGFVIPKLEKRHRKAIPCSYQAFINKTEKDDAGYSIYLTRFDEDHNAIEEVIHSSKNEYRKHVTLVESVSGSGYELYQGTKIALIASLLCWIAAFILLCIPHGGITS